MCTQRTTQPTQRTQRRQPTERTPPPHRTQAEESAIRMEERLWTSREILLTLYEYDRTLYQQCLQRELDDVANKDFTIVEDRNGRLVLRDLRVGEESEQQWEEEPGIEEVEIEEESQPQPQPQPTGPQPQAQPQSQPQPQQAQPQAQPQAQLQPQQPQQQQVEEMVLRKRVVPVEYDVGAPAKRAKRKDVEDDRLKVLRRVLDEGCKKGLWRYEVQLMENEEQQLVFDVKDVERREGEDEEMNKLRMLITKYTIYDRAERKCKSIKLFICLEAQRIFKTKKVSKAEYLRPFINTPEHRFLEYMLTIGLKLDSIQSWLDERKCAVDFWRLKELLDIDFSTTTLSQIKNVFK